MNKPIASFRADTDTKARFTTAEFMRIAETGAFADMKMELVDGELERMNTPRSAHGKRKIKIALRLGAVVPEALLIGEVGIDLDNDTVMACDVAILRQEIDQNRLLSPTDVLLVIEIAETTIARDLGLKRLAYAQADIAHYWVVDGGRSVVHVFGDPIDGEYAQVNTVRFGEPLAVPGTDATITLD